MSAWEDPQIWMFATRTPPLQDPSGADATATSPSRTRTSPTRIFATICGRFSWWCSGHVERSRSVPSPATCARRGHWALLCKHSREASTVLPAP